MINYAIVGGGRLARHFSKYFRLLEISHNCWTRDRWSQFNTFDLPGAEQRLKETVSDTDCVLLLVSDNAITTVLKQYPFLREKNLVHCSGSLVVPGVAGVHPLMTFTDRIYDLDTYKKIPFILEPGSEFARLFPGLPNPSFVINVEDRARYHAMCVMAGNFSQLLWKGVSDRFEQQFDLPAAAMWPYLNQVTENFIRSPGSALTGPLTRNDRQTIDLNLNSLNGDPLQDLYTAFVDFHQHESKQNAIPEQVKLEQLI
ncbi:MAG: DUF2520 domain-containing protein [Xanthomonadales bacterium]|nr:DUF2520 domain-containing protein [Xanthomonadales bacterium]